MKDNVLQDIILSSKTTPRTHSRTEKKKLETVELQWVLKETNFIKLFLKKWILF